MKSLHCAVCHPVKISLTRLSWMFVAGPGVPPPGRCEKGRCLAFAYDRDGRLRFEVQALDVLAEVESPSRVVGGPGFGGRVGAKVGPDSTSSRPFAEFVRHRPGFRPRH